jgi:DNA (cytosine-5)-methyltransferase 1
VKILNLYAGIGGNRKFWGDEHEITAVEYDEATAGVYQSYFKIDTVIITDAHKYLLDHYKEFDFIWSSPPCPTHSDIRRCGVRKGQYPALYPDMKLYQEIILLRHFVNKAGLFCIENVVPYYQPLIEPDVKLHRHLYWCNFHISNYKVTDKRKHNDILGSHSVYGFNITDTNIKDKRKSLRNMVDPELGRHILNCAMGVETVNAEQGDLF